MGRRKRKKIDSLEQAIVFVIVFMILFALNKFMPQEGETQRGLTKTQQLSFSMDEIPEFDESTPYVVINENKPDFEEKDFTTKSFEIYSDLDSLGRCRSCFCKCWNRYNANRGKRADWKCKTNRLAYNKI